MQPDKRNQEISVLGRLLSLEALVFLMGVVSLIHGLVAARLSSIAIGALIVVAGLVLARRWRRAQLK